MSLDALTERLSRPQRQLWDSFRTPWHIQQFLDRIPYAPESENRAPLRVLQEERGHCLDGGLLAAAALSNLGYPPLVVDLLPVPNMDDDHVLAIYAVDEHYGAVAKSNCAGLRFREPIFRTLRELVLSYFEDYFNTLGQKTLRGYTVPLNLTRYNAKDWTTDDRTADAIEAEMKHLRRFDLLTPHMIRNLSPVDDLSLRSGFLGSDPTGLYKPGIA